MLGAFDRRVCRWNTESGSGSMLVLGVLTCAAALFSITIAVGQVYAAQARVQQAADLAAASIRVGGDAASSRVTSLARANGASRVEIDVRGGAIEVVVAAPAPRVLGVGFRDELRASAHVSFNQVHASGAGNDPVGSYHGALVRVDGGIPICPRVAAAYREMQQSAAQSGVALRAVSGFRTYAEQAALFARLGPTLAAPPGASRHHDATELDLAVGAAGSPTHRWLQQRAPSHGFIQRYSWEPWHWGYVAGC
jgi:hypothetical protein